MSTEQSTEHGIKSSQLLVGWLVLCGVLWNYNWRTSNASKGFREVQIPLPLICLRVVHLHDACDVVQVPVVASDNVDLPVQ